MRTKTITLALSVMVGCATVAQAAGNRLYTTFSIGGAFVQDPDFSEISGASMPLQFTIANGQSLQQAWDDPVNAEFTGLAENVGLDLATMNDLIVELGGAPLNLNDPVPADAVGTYSTDASLKLDPGVRFDAAVGYQVTEAWAFELQSGLLYNSMDEMEVTVTTPLGSVTTGIPLDGSFYQVPILVNVIYTFQLDSKWKPYLGAGVGGIASFAEVRGNSESAFTFAYQGMAGVAYRVSENIDLGLAYKFLGTLEQEFDSVSFDPILSHSILAAFTYRF